MNRSILPIVGIIGLILASFAPVPLAHADNPHPFPDVDEDGLSNAMETGGWYNLAGGPFVTSASDADSDDDGLSDSEEKLFNTNPLDYQSPGLYARYENSFLTKQYFSVSDPAYLSWIRGGDRYLMTNAVVVRRGTTFRISGPISGTLSITGSGLTTLTPVKDACGGGWTVSVPSGGTVGTYTATLSQGGWSKSIPIYVIFEIPSASPSSSYIYNLPQEAIEAFLYDDDPSNLRDETAVRFYAPEWSYSVTCDTNPALCSSDQYHVTRGHAQVFWTQQFRKQAFLDHAMPAIQGKTSQSQAVNAIATWADREFRTNYAVIQGDFYSAMYRWNDGTGVTMDGGGCESNATVFTTLLRSAGIPARPFLEDYNKTPGHSQGGQFNNPYQYDHSAMVWVDGHWKGARSYNGSGGKYYPWTEGTVPHKELAGYYGNSSTDLIISVNGGWDWESEGGMVNDVVFPDHLEQGGDYYETWDYHWRNISPLEIEQSPYVDILNYEMWHGDNWAPGEWRNPPVSNPAGRVATQTYYLPSGVPDPANRLENWPYNPVPTGCSPYTAPDVCAAFLAGGGGAQVAVQPQTSQPNLALTGSAYKIFLPVVLAERLTPKASIQLGEIVGDHGADLDGDGRFDELVVEVKVTSSQAGYYQLGGWLIAGPGGQMIRSSDERIYLAAGVNTVSISFDGETIGDRKVNGPYQVVNLWVASPDQVIPKAMSPEEALDFQELDYSTAAYAADAFAVRAASFAGNFWHQGLDDNGDGYYESLAVYVPLDLALTGVYRVEGDLYDSQRNLVGHAAWTGYNGLAALQFPIAKTNPPYTLENLMLVDSKGALLDSRGAKAYKIADVAGMVYKGPVALSSLPSAGDFSAMAVTSTLSFTSTVVDTDSNGKFDQLVITAGVKVTGAGGTFRIEGLLVDQTGAPVAWAVSDPQTLSVGNRQMRLTFDGKVIHDHMPFSPLTTTFKLIGVKIFSGNLSSSTLEDQVYVAMTMPAYTRNQFDAASIGLFEDNLERGSITTNNWNAQSPWTLNTSVSHSPSHAWMASSTSGLLTSIPITLSNYTRPSLRFDACYQTNAGYVEVSPNGTAWTRVATYTNSSAPWTAQLVDLSSFVGNPNLRVRFNANSPGNWYVDDVYLNASPPETWASFNHLPKPVIVGANTSFIASYGFITTTPQVTLTWNFGDGSPLWVTHVSTATHSFPQALDYTVRLTVTNGYDNATYSDLVSAYALLNTYTTGPGSVYKNPDQSMYRHNDVVTLTAVAGPGAYFSGWSGDMTGTQNIKPLTINGNKVVTATFAEAEYHLAVNTIGSGSVVTTPVLPHYHYGNVVTLTAAAAPGWTFDRWSGDVDSTANPVTLTMNADKTVSAVFTPNDYTLAISLVGSGNVARSPNQPTYHYGDVVTLTANANSGWMFSNWSGDLSGGTNPKTITINGNKSVTATFSVVEYTLSVNASTGGSVTKNPSKATYHYGEVVTLTANANSGWNFLGWSGDLTGSQNPKTITMNGNKSVLATFGQNEYTLTTGANPSNGGTVTKNPSQSTYHYGDVVTLTASANAGWTFTGWSGDASGSQNPKTMTMDGNKSVTANFSQIDYTLTVNVVGGGSVTKNPSQTTYHYGDVVNLTPIADTGWEFSAWSGDLSGSANPTSITIYGNRTVTATFNRLGYTLSTGVSGGGSITRNPDKPTYLYGEVVTLTANADTYWSFSGWSGDLSGTTNPQTLVMNGPKSVIASFSPNGYLLNITLDGSGAVTKNPNKSVYQNGEVVTLTANANTGWTFTGWSGDMGGSQNPKTITMNGDKNVTASFSSDEYTLKVNNVGSGYVTKNPSKSFYYYGDVVSLTAYPLAGYAFSGWSGDLSGSTNPATITIISNKNVTATYTFVGFALTTNISGSGSIARNPDLPNYSNGTVVTLTANADSGWTFNSWSGAVTGSNNPATVTMNGNKVVTATFSQNDYTLTVYTQGNGSVAKNPDQTFYHYGDVVTLTANADAGWSLASWSGDLSGNETWKTIAINGNKVVTATFSQAEYTLALTTSGGGSAAKTPNLSHYHYGDVVTLSATANAGWLFTGWSGGLGGSANPATITMDGNKSVTANFGPIEYSLMVNVGGSGNVTKTPDQPTYHHGDVVTLTALAEAGWSFAGWSGDASGSETQKAITIDGNKIVLATFGLEDYGLTVNVVGGGSVAKAPDLTHYHYGDVVSLTANADPGWTFTGWSGDMGGGTANPQSITITGNKTVTATFDQIEYSLTVLIVGSGTVTKTPTLAHYHYGDMVTLTAYAATGWGFATWDGDLVGSANPKSIRMTGNKTVMAVFIQDEYSLVVNVVGSGEVEMPAQFTYHYGDTVVLTATPVMGWSFAGWSGDASGSANPLTLVMTGSRVVHATFTHDEYTLTVNTVGDGSVSKQPNQATYHYSDVVTLTATPATGASFIEWSGDLREAGSANPQSITINGNKTVTAAFTALPHAVTEVSFTFEPALPKQNEPVAFTPTFTPTNAAPPVTYTWVFGDNTPQLVTTTTTLPHTFGVTGTFTVWLTATNGYGSASDHRDVVVAGPSEENDYFIYLPIVMRE